ncbi:RDD family protein [Salibacterium lacus]|uniref:RDD family protein n=1 Tax=Salibacterium lacus TaxID=1898109 RepID=A0ABW5T003_9BACI
MDNYSDQHEEKWEQSEVEEGDVSRTESREEPTPVRYAGFWMRFWAYLLDLLIVFSVNGLLISPLWFSGAETMSVFGWFTLQGILSAATAYLYFLLMTKWRTQTLGKMVFGLRVIRRDHLPLRWMDLVFREIIGRFIHRSLWITNVLYIIIGFTEQKEGVHDSIADTRVIHVE